MMMIVVLYSSVWVDPTLSKREKLDKLFEKDHLTLDFTSPPSPKKKQIIKYIITFLNIMSYPNNNIFSFSLSLSLSRSLKYMLCRLGTGVSLDQVGAFFVAARGGRGGYGNAHFVSGKHRSPKQATSGTCGEEKQYTFTL
jgi:hypothetical protein